MRGSMGLSNEEDRQGEGNQEKALGERLGNGAGHSTGQTWQLEPGGTGSEPWQKNWDRALGTQTGMEPLVNEPGQSPGERTRIDSRADEPALIPLSREPLDAGASLARAGGSW